MLLKLISCPKHLATRLSNIHTDPIHIWKHLMLYKNLCTKLAKFQCKIVCSFMLQTYVQAFGYIPFLRKSHLYKWGHCRSLLLIVQRNSVSYWRRRGCWTRRSGRRVVRQCWCVSLLGVSHLNLWKIMSLILLHNIDKAHSGPTQYLPGTLNDTSGWLCAPFVFRE